MLLAVGAPVTGHAQSSRERAIERHLPLVVALARRYANRGEAVEDLVQVGSIGLIKAVDRFDAGRGVDFRVFATLTIVGEIKRHLRDRTTAIRVPRREQEARLRLRRARTQLRARLERAPSWSELLAADELPDAELSRGLRAEGAATPLSLSVTPEAEPSVDEPGYAVCEDRAYLWRALRMLDARERRALALCHLSGLSQREAAACLGISQSETSRLVTRAMAKLRAAAGVEGAAIVRTATSA